jgi:hypothetical protein
MYTYTSEDYDTMRKMNESQLAETWREDCTAEDYEYMLESLPPKRWRKNAFLVGECLTHGIEGAIYDAFIEINGQHFQRPAYLKHFNPDNYIQEIKRITGD